MTCRRCDARCRNIAHRTWQVSFAKPVPPANTSANKKVRRKRHGKQACIVCGCRNDGLLHHWRCLGADLRGDPARSRIGVPRRAWAWHRQAGTLVRRQRRRRRAVRGRSRQGYREDRDPRARGHGRRHCVRARRHHGLDRLPHRRPLCAEGRRPDQKAGFGTARDQLARVPQGRPALCDASVSGRRAL